MNHVLLAIGKTTSAAENTVSWILLENGDISGWVFGSSKRALRVSASLVGNVLTASLPGRANMEDFVDALDVRSISVSFDEGASWAAQVDVQDPLSSHHERAAPLLSASWSRGFEYLTVSVNLPAGAPLNHVLLAIGKTTSAAENTVS